MNLSRHFTLTELTFSRTAAAEGIDNTPTDAERSNLEVLCTSVLDPLRDAAGAAIKVTSGYRGPVLNRRIKGELKSQHLEGKAADIQPTTMSVLELFKTVVRLALPFDQVIYENKSATSKWVHVSHNAATNRGQILIAHFLPSGRVERYEPVTAAQVLAMQEAVSRSTRRLDDLEYDEMDDEPRDDDEPEAELPEARVQVVPAKPAAATAAAKKAASGKKAAGKKKATAKKVTVKKATGKKTVAKKTSAKKAPQRPTAAKKAAVKKVTAKKATRKKTAAAKKLAAKKTVARTRKPASRKTSKPAARKRSRQA